MESPFSTRIKEYQQHADPAIARLMSENQALLIRTYELTIELGKLRAQLGHQMFPETVNG